ncbi:hypothetical protein K501DRAFT_279832 [Backusella circina FSU 941]|nr:hypothetical protein K501DRAFT_279832 [Backusella circina FSU 941]
MRTTFILLAVFYLCIITISEAAPATTTEEVTVQVENSMKRQLSRHIIHKYKKRSARNRNIKDLKDENDALQEDEGSTKETRESIEKNRNKYMAYRDSISENRLENSSL